MTSVFSNDPCFFIAVSSLLGLIRTIHIDIRSNHPNKITVMRFSFRLKINKYYSLSLLKEKGKKYVRRKYDDMYVNKFINKHKTFSKKSEINVFYLQ